MSSDEFINAYDDASDAALRETRRGHLGASQIGVKCARQAFLDFRWCGLEAPGGRMRRLWQRGHDEEHNFVRWLRAMGIEVRDYAERLWYHDGSNSYFCEEWDWECNPGDPMHSECVEDVHDKPYHIRRATEMHQAPKQWGFKTHNGHYAGSGDGKVSDESVAAYFPKVAGKGWGALECKTHNEKSFSELKRKGVQQAKPVHYIQMQQYMHHLECEWALYIAVNKNTDEIYVEIVMRVAQVGEMYTDRAAKVIDLKQPPARITEDPSWFECRFCPHRGPCHYGEKVDVNCRSCAYAEPVADGEWRCGLFKGIIPKDFIPKGCDKWESVL